MITKLREEQVNPKLMALFSTLCSVLIYLLIYFIFNLNDFKLGLIVSIIIPVAVTLPLSFLMANYHKKIDKQREELKRMNFLNKNLFNVSSI